MSSVVQATTSVATFARSLIMREQFRSGGDVESAIQRVARRLKVGPGTIANLVRNRVKSVCFSIGQAIITAAIHDIENERKQLEHERDLLLGLDTNADHHDLIEAEDALEKARACLARMRAAR